jgi:hypothetical protein
MPEYALAHGARVFFRVETNDDRVSVEVGPRYLLAPTFSNLATHNGYGERHQPVLFHFEFCLDSANDYN